MLALVSTMDAQLKTPSASPSSTATNTVGLTDVKIEYSRPGVKGRTIFAADGLVPFGKKWRTGANQVTTFTFSTDVTVGGAELKKGAYAIFTVPNPESWDVHFYEYTGAYTGDYKEATPVANIKATVITFPAEMKIETFTIDINNIKNNSATMEFYWENTMAFFDLAVATDETVYSSIDKVMAGPGHSDYYSAASYYKSTGKDNAKALEWMNKSIELRGEEKFWVLKNKSEIEASLGKYKDAIKTAEKSMTLAKEAENMDYVKMNTDNIAKWSKMK